MNGQEFEVFFKLYFEKLGYIVDTASSLGTEKHFMDHNIVIESGQDPQCEKGIELIVKKSGRAYLVHAVRGLSVLGEDVVLKIEEALSSWGLTKGIIVTYGEVPVSIRKLMAEKDLNLVDKESLSSFIDQHFKKDSRRENKFRNIIDKTTGFFKS